MESFRCVRILGRNDMIPVIRIINKILNWLSFKCPDKCGGKIHAEDYDMMFDKLVWKCDKCKKEFI